MGPLGVGSLTFDAMKFPIAKGTVPVNVDISLSSLLPAALATTKTIAKATTKNGEDLFCIEIDSAPSSKQDGDHSAVDALGAGQLKHNSLPIAPSWLGSGYRTMGDSRSIVRYLKSGRHTCTDGDNFTHTTCVNKLLGHFERKVVIKCMSCMQYKNGRGSLAQFCSEK